MPTFLQDVRYGLRMLVKYPGFTAVAVITLTLGIGANTAIFTVANSLLLRPLPYRDPGGLVLVFSETSFQKDQSLPFSYLRFRMMNEQGHSFSGLAAFTNETFNLTGGGDPEQVSSARVSWNFFDVLGVRPDRGRSFAADEDQAGGKNVALISHELWVRRFGANPSLVGQNITLDSQSYTVAGVLPPGFRFAPLGANVDVFVPRVFELNLITPQQVQAGAGFLNAVGRLAPGVSLEKAQAEVDLLSERYRRENPTATDSAPNTSVKLDHLQNQVVSNFRPALLILLAAVGVVLLIACANVTNLLLSRSLTRRKEMAVRAALGAGQSRLFRQLLIETLMLAAVACAGGVLLGYVGTRVLVKLGHASLPPSAEPAVDFSVLLFSLAISVASGILVGLLPGKQISRVDLNSVLRDEGRANTGGPRRHAARSLLVISQVALCMVLLFASGLLVRSFIRLRTSYPGFDSRNVLTLQINLPTVKYGKRPELVAFYNQVLQGTRALPGVEASAISSALPLNPSRFSPVLVEGQAAVPLSQRPVLSIQTISPDYARVYHVPLLRGREFSEQDDASAPLVAIVNQALVHRFWPDENPIGKHLWLGRMTKPAEVVGVLGDVKNLSLVQNANPEVMLPFPQLPWATLNLSLRTSVEPHSIVPAVRRAILSIDKDQPITQVQSLDEILEAASAQPRFTMLLLGLFAATAFVLAIVGIYGVVAYSVSQRTHEVGIRMALGAVPDDILKMVVIQGMTLVGVGIAAGVAASLALSRLLASQLYQIRARDPITLAVSVVIFVAVALLASYLPARRATKVDPMVALRYE